MRLAVFVVALLVAGAAHAEDFLARVMQRLAEPPVVRATFVQERFVGAIARPAVSRGRLIVSRREGVLWQIETPVQVALAFTPTQIIETGPDGLRRLRSQRRGAVEAEIGHIMRGILGADADELRADFEASAEGSLERWTIRLAPKAREVARFLKAINLGGARHLETIEIHEASGDRTAIRLRDYSTAAELDPDEREQFKAP